VNDELGAHDAVRLGIAAALEPSRLPQQPHLFAEALDDGVDPRFFIRNRTLLGDLEAPVGTLAVDQGRGDAGNRIAQQRIKRRAIERIEAALKMNQRG